MMEGGKSIRVNGEGSDQKNTEEKPIHIKFTGVRGIKRCAQNDNIIQWSEYDILGSVIPKNSSTSSGLKSPPRLGSTSSTLRTPKLGNTMLHKAAWRGNDKYVVTFVNDSPDLLFQLNENKDTPLNVAARAGKIHTMEKLLAAYADFKSPEIAMAWLKYTNSSKPVEDYDAKTNMEDLLGLVKMTNKEGNTMLHEAVFGNNNILGLVFTAFKAYNNRDRNGESLAESCYKYALEVENKAQRSVLYLAVEVEDRMVVKLMLDKCPEIVEPKGLSPFLPAITKQNKVMLEMLLEKRLEWIHLEDQNGRILLHYAAYRGFLDGVRLIIKKCECCVFRSDEDGYFPIHLAAYGGHVKVVKELLNHCNDPAEMLDNDQRNILHIAAKNGNHAVVHYILKNRNLVDLINQKDYYGDTPLHLATRSCHPKTVYYLIWNNKVDLNSVNFNSQTPLDIINGIFQIETEPISPYQLEKGSDREQLTWIALKSAGAESHTTASPVDSKNKASKEKVSKPAEGYSKKIENLSVISTLIITASVAACLAVPGEAEGKAHNLNKSMFQVFIICITVSLFSSIIATIILLWTRIGLTELVTFSISIVTQLIGIALFTLSLAFMAGLFTVVNELPWLAYVFLGLCVIFIVVGSLLYAFLFFPSTSTSSNKIIRWISYYPFIILATLAERKYY